MSKQYLLFTITFELMKKFSSINPIPKRVFNMNNRFMLMLFYGVIFCTELKAIPEDWPSTDGASFVNMQDDIAMQLSCHGTVQISVDQSGVAMLTPQMLLVDYYPSYSRFKVVVNQTGSNKVTCADIGKVITATVTDTTNGMMCWSYLVVEDKLIPTIICRGDTISCTNDPFQVDYSTFVQIFDNCDVNIHSYYDITLDLYNCSNNRYSSVVHLKWTAVDDYGNTNTCLQDIYFKKSSVDSVVFPLNDTVYCPNADLNSTGVPTLFGDTVSHLCQLLVTHVDDSIIVCGGMMKIRRLWTVMDWCNSTLRSATQEILVADTTRPDIICPADVTLYSDFVTCRANFRVPSFVATDACSPSNLLLLVVRIDSSYFSQPGQVIPLGVGVHSVNYIAIDPCGNADTCTSYVTVRDKISPSLICPPALVVSLSPLGYVLLTADFIAGNGLVTDNCCLDTITVRRMTMACQRPQDTLFRDVIEFCCDDIGDTLMIVLKATDCSGNMNFCMIQIIVQDKNPTSSSACPPTITLPCDTNYLDLNVTGPYYTVTSCLDTIQAGFNDVFQPDSCGEGTITRNFYFVLPDGSQIPGCQQLINIYNDYIFSAGDVTWPGDIIISKCANNNPDSIFSKPRMAVNDCGSVYFTYVDLPIQLTIDSCEYFDRIWTAYAACTQQSVKDTQRISLIDLQKAKLIAPSDTLVANTPGMCMGFVSLQPAVLLGCAGNLQITNSYNNEGEDASDFYPVGTTMVVFTATDLCGVIHDTLIVVVRDLENPFIECDFFEFDMMPNDSIKLGVKSLLINYEDNCTSADSLHISFTLGNFNDTVRYITCADLPNPPDTLYYTIYIEDAYGNSDSCVSEVKVTDTHLYCPTAIRVGDVGGYITDLHSKPMKGVEVELLGLNQSIVSDENGYYIFADIVTNHEYMISPSYNKNWLEGVTTQDIVKIQRHILGLEPFDLPYKWIAADLDKNGRVTSADIVWLRRLILGKSFEVPTNQSWRFVNKAYSFINPEFPLEEKFEEKTVLKGLWHDTIVHYDAIKVGDVSAFSGFVNMNERLRSVELAIDSKTFKNDELFRVDVYTENEIDMDGFQMNFNLDPSYIELYRIQEFINQTEGRNLDQDEYNCDGRQLSVVFLTNASVKPVRGKLLSLLFKAKRTGNVKEVFTPGSFISNEVYLKKDVPVKILFKYKESPQANTELLNWYVDPNPFKERCVIEFISTHSEEIKFNLYDLTGKSVLTKSVIISKGKNSIVINADELAESGTYIYYVSASDHSYHGKIIKIE